MRTSFDSRLSVPEHVLVRELDEEAVLLNLHSKLYFGLDGVGARMWQALTTSVSIQAAYERLLAEYEVEPETLQRDLAELVESLLAQDLLLARNA